MRFSLSSSAMMLLVAAGCASTQSSSATTSVVGDGRVRWTASLKPTGQRTGNLAAADKARAYGQVNLTTSVDDPNRTDVNLTVDVPSSAVNSLLPWAMLPGRCGSGDVPIMAIQRFQPIEVGGNGRGQLSSSLAMTLPEAGSYHINVYWPGGSQLSDVMTCGNMSRG